MGLTNLWKKSRSEPKDTGVLEYSHGDSHDDSSTKKVNFESTQLADNSSEEFDEKYAPKVADPEDSAGSKAYNHVFKDPEVARYWQNLYQV